MGIGLLRSRGGLRSSCFEFHHFQLIRSRIIIDLVDDSTKVKFPPVHISEDLEPNDDSWFETVEDLPASPGWWNVRWAYSKSRSHECLGSCSEDEHRRNLLSFDIRRRLSFEFLIHVLNATRCRVTCVAYRRHVWSLPRRSRRTDREICTSVVVHTRSAPTSPRQTERHGDIWREDYWDALSSSLALQERHSRDSRPRLTVRHRRNHLGSPEELWVNEQPCHRCWSWLDEIGDEGVSLVCCALPVRACSIPSMIGRENRDGSSSLGRTDSNINCRSGILSRRGRRTAAHLAFFSLLIYSNRSRRRFFLSQCSQFDLWFRRKRRRHFVSLFPLTLQYTQHKHK